MKIYRVEFPHPDGGFIGPYNCDTSGHPQKEELDAFIWRMAAAHSWGRSDRHPPLWGPSGCSIAVRSMQDLFSWFGGYLPGLLKFGARIGVYEVEPEDIVEEDPLQLAFIRDRARDVTPSS